VPTIGFLFVNQSHSCDPDRNSKFSVIVSTPMTFNPALASSWRNLAGSCY
jgi:hypothetical protein